MPYELPAKEPQVLHYELLSLVVGRFTDEQVSVIVDEVRNIINEAGATNIQDESMGRRPLAYRIEGDRNGTYHVFEFDCDTAHLSIIHEKLRIRKDIARFMIVKKRPVTAEQRQAYEALRAQLLAERQAEKDKAAAEKKPASTPVAPIADAPAAVVEADSAGEVPSTPEEKLDTLIDNTSVEA